MSRARCTRASSARWSASPATGFFQGLPYPDRPHCSAFDWDTCDAVFRDGDTYVSQPPPEDTPGSCSAASSTWTATSTGATARWCSRRSCPRTRRGGPSSGTIPAIEALLDRLEPNGRADLNVEFFSAIPLLTITGSFGISIADSLDIRAAVISDGHGMEPFVRIVPADRQARRDEPRDDLISVLVAAEITEEDGSTHRLTDQEVLVFAFLLLAAGSGTTWKQMGITMLALLWHPEWLDAVQQDRTHAPPGGRGVGALDAHRPDVQPLRRARHRRSAASTSPRVR